GDLYNCRACLDREVVQHTGAKQALSKGLGILDRVELHSYEDVVWVVDPSRHHVPLGDVPAARRITVEHGLPVVVVVLEVHEHEGGHGSLLSSRLRSQPARSSS